MYRILVFFFFFFVVVVVVWCCLFWFYWRKMKSSLFFLAIFLVAFCVAKNELDEEESSYMDLKYEPQLTTSKWMFSVLPVEEANRNPDPHVSQFPFFYTFCLPLSRVPAGDFSATLEIDFVDTTNEVVIDFDFNGHSFDYVTKDATPLLSLSLHSDNEDLNGWSSEEGFKRPLSGRVYTKVPAGRVTLTGEGSWKQIHDLNLLCNAEKPQEQSHTIHNQEDQHQEEEMNGPALVISEKHYPIVILCVSVLMFFSILMCCCQCSTVRVSDEEDLIAEMEQFSDIPQEECGDLHHDDLVVRDVGEVSEEEILRRVQEQSRMEYEQQNMFTVGGQREALAQYMQPSIMSPEQYSNYLASTRQ